MYLRTEGQNKTRQDRSARRNKEIWTELPPTYRGRGRRRQ